MPTVLICIAAGLVLLVPRPQAASAASQGGVTLISAGMDFSSCAIESGRAYCWGANNFGQLGDESTTDSDVPVPGDISGVLAGKTLTQIAAGIFGNCALDTVGTAYCWGYNGDGELGNGSTTDSDVPVAVDTGGVLAGKTLTQVTAGGGTMCALDSSGAAYCWGNNGSGELGNGSTTDSSVPVAVDTSGVLAGKTVTQISAGWEFACALDSTAAAYCWGDNGSGQFGDGSTVSSSVPVAVDTGGVLAGQTLTQISAGVDTCALDSSGAAYCWGYNGDGELGDDSTSPSDVPVLTGPEAPTAVTAVSGDNTAAVSWTAPASLDGGSLTGYTATASPGGQTCSTTGATNCTITCMTNGTTYSITVVAATTVGESGSSSPSVLLRAAESRSQVTRPTRSRLGLRSALR
jgi:alpha-tubulin suppressor-like RCC1 family protein